MINHSCRLIIISSDFNDDDKKLVSSTTVPLGAKFWDGDNSDECEKGKSECKVIWARKNYLDDWDIEANDECEKDEFIGDSNDFCRMFGDCGADVNLLEVFTDDGLDVSWKGKNSFDGKTARSPKNVPAGKISELKTAEGIFGGMVDLNNIYSDTFKASTEGNVVLFDLLMTWYHFAEASWIPMIGPLGQVGLIAIIVLSIIFGDELGEILGDFGCGTESNSAFVY